MSKEELNPCPFCAGPAKVIKDDIDGSSWVQCQDCFAETFCDFDEHDAIAAWNTRAGEQGDEFDCVSKRYRRSRIGRNNRTGIWKKIKRQMNKRFRKEFKLEDQNTDPDQ
jgi:Lar family restriction alleviation protein